MIMKMTPQWPTMFGSGKFEVDGLVEHIFTNYDLHDLDAEVDGCNIFDDDSDVMHAFKELVYDHFNSYLKETINKEISDWNNHEMKGWITGHGKDYSMTIHNHSGAHLSAVFYVMAEDQNSGGDIVFSDPRSNANRGYDSEFEPMFERFKHTPQTGDYLIFPSFTYHHVNPYYSSLRIAIPIDLYLHSG
tara:strand:- start:1331 stop:1897 length:567 start_codon:yes stop_codon:yes gene_type:complete